MRKGTGDELVEEGCGAARGCAAGDEGDGPLRHRVVSREVLDGLVGSDVDEEGVDLDEFARPDRLHGPGQALGVALAHVRKRRGACGGLRRLPALNNRANHALSTKRRQTGIVSYAPDKPARAIYTADFISASTNDDWGERCAPSGMRVGGSNDLV